VGSDGDISIGVFVKKIEHLGSQLEKTKESIAILKTKVEQLKETDKAYCEKLAKMENRVREIENWKNKLVGYFAAMGTLGGLVGAGITLLLT